MERRISHYVVASGRMGRRKGLSDKSLWNSLAGLQIESIIEYKVSTSAWAEKEKDLFADVLITDGPVGEPGIEG